MKIIGLIILFCISIYAQTWNYNLGSVIGSFNSGESETFLPAPEVGGGLAARVRVGTQGGSFNLENQTISFGSDSYLRGVAATGGSLNKFSIYDYNKGESFTIRFRVRFGTSDGQASETISGNWYFFIGDGASYSNNNKFTSDEVFTGIQWILGNSGNIACNYRNGSTWVELSDIEFTQGVTYIVDIYGNNTSETLNYNYETQHNINSNTFDIWVDGNLVGENLPKAEILDESDIDSWMFYGGNSAENLANIFLDDIYYSNEITTDPLPVELNSFTAKVIDEGVKLNWQTETEVHNYGFEIERAPSNPKSAIRDPQFTRIGFVAGNGNSNSPKEYSFIDKKVLSGKYLYRLKQIDTDGKFEYSKTIKVSIEVPDKYELSQNYPNPFNPVTTINYSLPLNSFIRLEVVNTLGKTVEVLYNGLQERGGHSLTWNADKCASGIYFLRFYSSNSENNRSFNKTIKMILLK